MQLLKEAKSAALVYPLTLRYAGTMSRRLGIMEIHGAVALFGLAGLFGKWLPFSPALIVWGRVTFAASALAVLHFFLKRSITAVSGRDLAHLALQGLILAVHWTTFFQAIQVSSVAVGLLSFAAYPVFTILLEPILLRERFSPSHLIFAALCLLGVFLIVPRFSLENAVFLGVLWGVFSGLTFAILTIFNRGLVRRLPSLTIVFYQDFFAALFLLPFAAALRTRLSARSWLLLAVLGILCTALSHSLFIRGMKFVRAQTASLIHALEPVYGVIFAFWLLNEAPTERTLLGGAVILTTQAMVLFDQLRSGRHRALPHFSRRPGNRTD